MHGAFFGVAEGRLLVRGAKSGSFEPVEGSIRENLRQSIGLSLTGFISQTLMVVRHW
ncbi:hypothetical protein Brsp06_04823 [Brucella sp. NBRC 13694]